MTLSRKYVTATLVAAVSCIALPFVAADQDDQRGKRRGPPPEAVEACASLSEGSVCSFDGRRGEVQGSCIVVPNDSGVIACKPQGGREGGRRSQSGH